MQIHNTSNLENVQPGARPQFQIRIKSIAISATLAAVAGMSCSSALAASNERSHARRVALESALWLRCMGDTCSLSPECLPLLHLG